MRKLFLNLLLITGTFPAISQTLQEVDSLPVMSLQDAVSIGLENNYDIHIARYEKLIEDNNYSLGNAGMLPQVNITGGQSNTIEQTDQTFVNGESQVVNWAPTSNFSAGASLEWTIFDGLKMFASYDKLEKLKKAGESQLRTTLVDAVSQINEAYYNVAVEQKRLELYKETLQLSQQRVTIAQDKYELGNASKLEYLQARVDYNKDLSAAIAQQETLLDARVTLNEALGRSPDKEFRVVNNDWPIREGLGFEDLLSEVYANNPSLQTAQYEKSIADLAIREQSSDRLPEVNINLGYEYNALDASAGFLTQRRANALNYGISAQWNVFNGNNTERQIQNARITSSIREERLQQLKLQLEANLQKVFFEYQNSLQLMKLEKENLSVAEENAEIALERYKLGVSNALELREAQTNALEAQIRYQNAAFKAKSAEIKLLQLSGEMIE